MDGRVLVVGNDARSSRCGREALLAALASGGTVAHGPLASTAAADRLVLTAAYPGARRWSAAPGCRRLCRKARRGSNYRPGPVAQSRLRFLDRKPGSGYVGAVRYWF